MAALLQKAARVIGYSIPNLGDISGPAPPASPSAGKRKLSCLIDPNLEAEITPPSGEETRRIYKSFDTVNGGLPSKAEKPSGDQLKALQALLDSDSVPYTDFSLWVPHGKRAQKALKCLAFI